MDRKTLNQCRAHALRVKDLRAELEAVYNPVSSVPFSNPWKSSRGGSGSPTERAAMRAIELEKELQEAQESLFTLADEIEEWAIGAGIDPGARAGIRLFYSLGMDWREIDERLKPKVPGAKVCTHYRAKTEKALKAAGIT